MKNTDGPLVGDEILQDMFSKLIKESEIDLIIETGTFKGATTKFLASFGIPVTSFEINEIYFQEAQRNLKGVGNVTLINKCSRDGLDSIRDQIIGKNLFIFLDAHWENDNALIDELNFLINLGSKPIIAIHDWQVPNHPEMGFDIWNGKAYNYNNYKHYFDKLYGESGYEYWYNTESRNSVKRGVIFLKSK